MGNINNIHKENGLQIDNLFSLGSGCLGFKFANLFNKRIKGPVDNISNPTSFRALYKIFNGSLFKKIINKEYDKIEQDEYKNNLYCYDGDFWVTHNNPLEDKYIIEFQNRVNNFNSFVKTINEYNNNYFLFAINYNDKTITQEDLDNLQKIVNFNIYDKIFILGAAHMDQIPEILMNNFKCFYFNYFFDDKNAKKWYYM